MITLDASVVIALFDDGDPHHVDAIELFDRTTDEFVIHPITAAEVLVGPAKAGLADQVWRDLEELGVNLDQHPVDPIRLAMIRATSGCKLPDCCVLATAMHHRCRVATFDERLARAAAAIAVPAE